MQEHPGFTISGAEAGALPLIMASPHSGRDYPPAFLATTRLGLGQLRRAEDAFVDALLDGAAGLGVPVIAARYGRAWLDLNRDAAELDPGMFVDWRGDPTDPTDRVSAGLGVLPRVAAQGLDIYASKLRLAEARARIDEVHVPWHDTLARYAAAARARHGFAILLDCHSMPTPAAAGGGPAQVVLGDLHGTSAGPALVDFAEAHFRGEGLRVMRNVPYAGGYTTTRHGAPSAGIHVLQIEIDRALYMEPARLARHAGFARVAAAFTSLARTLCAVAPRLGLAPPLREAAE